MEAIELAVGECLAALGRYEDAFRTAYTEQGGSADALRIHTACETFDEGWSRHLAAADQSADDVEGLLAEQEIVWKRWRELMACWRRSLERPPELDPETAHAFLRSDPPRRRAVEALRRY